MRNIFMLGAAALVIPGCTQLDGMADRFGLSRGGSEVPQVAATAPYDPFVQDGSADGSSAALDPATAAAVPAPTAVTAETLDTTTPAQRAAASAPVAGDPEVLGKTIVSLGDPTEPGLWLKTPLVKAERQGRVTNPATGKASTVTLIPLDGPETGGSRMSLAAIRLIGASLTDLTEVAVSAL